MPAEPPDLLERLTEVSVASYIVLLRFSHNKAAAGQHLAGHNAWVARGLAAHGFLMVASLVPRLGGALLVHGPSRHELDALLADDPFVAHGVVTAEVLEFAPAQADPRLAFLLA